LSAARPLRIGTRGSRLALWQADTVAARLKASGVESDLVILKTTGDRSQEHPVPGDDSKRQFVKELEEALLADEVDLAVHSAKDLPVDLPDGLVLSACLPREDPRDAFVLPVDAGPSDYGSVIAQLAGVTRIGTGSVRRSAQLVPALPRVTFVPIRGNVDTRVRKLDAGEVDALILACAGLRRLGLDHRISAAIPVDQCVPAPGQGIVATEIRAEDAATRAALDRIHDAAAGAALTAERAVVIALGGGCQLPLGAIAVRLADGGHGRGALELQAAVAASDGSRVLREKMTGDASAPEDLGRRVAEALASAGALTLLHSS
jgi:hydroxymethylbilane synthase